MKPYWLIAFSFDMATGEFRASTVGPIQTIEEDEAAEFMLRHLVEATRSHDVGVWACDVAPPSPEEIATHIEGGGKLGTLACTSRLYVTQAALEISGGEPN